jgi:hypothetical protein
LPARGGPTPHFVLRRPLAEAKGFEPLVPVKVRRFSKCGATRTPRVIERHEKVTRAIGDEPLVYSRVTKGASWDVNHDG